MTSAKEPMREFEETQRCAKGEETVMHRKEFEMTTKASHHSPKGSAKSKLKKALNRVIITIISVPRIITEGI